MYLARKIGRSPIREIHPQSDDSEAPNVEGLLPGLASGTCGCLRLILVRIILRGGCAHDAGGWTRDEQRYAWYGRLWSWTCIQESVAKSIREGLKLEALKIYEQVHEMSNHSSHSIFERTLGGRTSVLIPRILPFVALRWNVFSSYFGEFHPYFTLLKRLAYKKNKFLVMVKQIKPHLVNKTSISLIFILRFSFRKHRADAVEKRRSTPWQIRVRWIS